MIRPWLGRLALRAYPSDVTRASGAEMLSTVLDMGSGSIVAFTRELVLLVFCGLRERSSLTASSGRRQLVADACSAALIIYLCVPTWSVLSHIGLLRGEFAAIVAISCVSLVLLLVGYRRAVGIFGLAAIGVGVAITALQGQPGLENVFKPFVDMAIPTVCCAILAATPDSRPRHPRRLLWFVLLVLLAIVLPPQRAGGMLLGLDYQQAFLVAASVVGLMRLAYDPRIALGCGLVWAAEALRLIYGNAVFGLGERATAILWASALILGAAVIRLALMRHQRPA